MQTEDLNLGPLTTINLGPIPTFVMLALATYGAGTLGGQVGIVATTFIRNRKARKESDTKQDHATK